MRIAGYKKKSFHNVVTWIFFFKFNTQHRKIAFSSHQANDSGSQATSDKEEDKPQGWKYY